LEIVKQTEEHAFKVAPKSESQNQLFAGNLFIKDCPKLMKDYPNVVWFLFSYQ